jgi:phosphoglycolate phosphatase-like HAD superfamily hydrolase
MKGIIFDLDGTLVSVRPEYRYDTVSKVLAGFGKRVARKDMDTFWFGHSRDLMIENWGVVPKDFWKEFHALDDPEHRRRFTFAFDDCSHLAQLKKKGYKLALCTGAPPRIADMELDFLDRSVFDSIVIAHPYNDVKPKPDPMGIHECLRILKTGPGETMLVGNSDEDIMTARNARIKSVIVDRKEHSHTLEPDRLITSLRDL